VTPLHIERTLGLCEGTILAGESREGRARAGLPYFRSLSAIATTITTTTATANASTATHAVMCCMKTA
jgi:hypothetical protein